PPAALDGERATYGLLERLRGGDREAANELFSIHGERLRRALRVRLPRDARFLLDGDQLVQATLCRALKDPGRFRRRGPRAGLALNPLGEEAARARSAAARRPARERRPDESGSALQHVAERESRSPSRLAERLEDWRLMEEALDHLGDEDREVIVLRQILGQ